MTKHKAPPYKQSVTPSVKDTIQLVSNKLSEERYQHSLGVAKLALSLAIKHEYSTYPCVIAGLLHDVAKEYSVSTLKKHLVKMSQPVDAYTQKHSGLWHALVSRQVAEEQFGISDHRILSAIENHPLGKPAMSPVELILFLSDYCEPYRRHFDPAPIRKIAFNNLNLAAYLVLKEKHKHLYRENITPHPQSIEAIKYYKPKGVKQK